MLFCLKFFSFPHLTENKNVYLCYDLNSPTWSASPSHPETASLILCPLFSYLITLGILFFVFFFLNSSYDSPTGFWTCYLLYQIYCSPNIYTTSSFLASLSSYKWIPFCTAHLKKFTFLPDTSNSLLLSNYFLLGRYSYLTNYYLIITYIACLWHWNISFKKKVVFPFCVQLYSQMHKTVFDT